MKCVSILYNLIKILCWEGLEISEMLLKELLQFIDDHKIRYNEIISERKDKVIKEYLKEQIYQRIPKRL
jgi:hypothetical protein